MKFSTFPKLLSLTLCLIQISHISCDLSKIDDELSSPTPTANFDIIANQTPCRIPCEIAVDASSSQNATSFSWDFGEGTMAQGVQASHTYLSTGTFSLKLDVTGPGGNNSLSKSVEVLDSLSTGENPDPTANFEIDSTTNLSFAPSEVFFRNTSMDADSYEWNFNDPTSGSANTSTEFNPSHTFMNPGIYQVQLTAKSSQTNTENSVQKEIVINQTPTYSSTISIGSSQGFGFDFALSGQGNYVLAHNSGSLNIGQLTLADPSGNFISTQDYTFFLRSSFQDIHPLPNGNVVITGTLSGGIVPGSNLLFLETDGNGNEVQKMTYNVSEFESGSAITPTLSGGYAIAGTELDQLSETLDGSALLLLLDSEGNALTDFPKFYSMGRSPIVQDILAMSNGNFAILGDYPSFGTNTPGLIFVILTDPNGEQLPGSPRIYEHERFEQAGRLIETSSGGLAIVGSSGLQFEGSDALLILTDQNGNELPFSPKRIDLGPNDVANGIALLSGGGFALTGHRIADAESLADVFLLFTDANGNQVGQAHTFGASGTEDYGLDLYANPDGGFTILGYTKNFSDTHDAMLIKTDANGEVR